MYEFSSSSREITSQVHVVKLKCQPSPLHNAKLLCIYIQSCFLIIRKLFRVYALTHTQRAGCEYNRREKWKTREPGKALKIRKCLCNIFKAFDKLHYLDYQFFFLYPWLILLIYYSFRLFSVASSEFKKEQPRNKVSIMSCWIKCAFVQSEIEGSLSLLEF